MCLTNSQNFYAPMNFVKAILIHFSEKWGRLSSKGSKTLAFSSHCSANFQPILDCFIPKFKLEYDNFHNIKTDCVNTVVFSLHQIKQSRFFLGHPVVLKIFNSNFPCSDTTLFLSLEYRYLFDGVED